MTDEQFDSTRFCKGMRCSMTLRTLSGRDLIIYGTIVSVHFGGRFFRVRFDGKDVTSKVYADRITLLDS